MANITAVPRESSSTLSNSGVDNAQPKGERQVYLSLDQRMALEWLTGGGTITEAAQYADVSRQSVYNWLHEDADFKAVYDQWRKESLIMTQGRLLALTESAVDTLSDAIRNKRNVRAAQFMVKQMCDGKIA